MVEGELLRAYRVRDGLSQSELAKQAGLSVRALRDIERGRVRRPHPSSLRRLADALVLSGDERERLVSRPGGGVSVSILGPLVVVRDGQHTTVVSLAAQRLLGLLALESDRVVALDELADAVWGAHPPAGWRNRLHVHIGQLRRLLEPQRRRRAASDALPAHARGYQLRVPTDARRFNELVAAAEGSGDCALYARALACWRGPVLSNDDGRLSGRPAAEALRRARVNAVLALADAAARGGRHELALPWLEPIAGEEPLHEGVHGRLMRALAHTGRQDGALRVYAALRARLAEELGVDPARETQAAYLSVLGAGEAPAEPAPVRPAQLPMPGPVFAGRDADIARLLSHLTGPPRPGEIPAPRVVVVHGMPGVGKTELVLHVAARLRQRYPDGQLFADLQGEREHPAPAAQVLAGFLRALGIAPQRIPADVGERSATLRSYLAGRKVLMVLDDARSAGQVLPLLPADAGNDVLVTSRSALAELPVCRHRLETLGPADPVAVLVRYLEGEDAAADSVADHCGGLPLALRIAAARAQAFGGLNEVAALLRDTARRTEALHSGHLAVRASFESSDRRLSPPARTALRRLAALPTAAFPGWAVRVCMGTGSLEAHRILADLIDAHLVSASAGMFTLHDLVRGHALAGATTQDAQTVERVAVQWFRLAEAAALRITARGLHLDPLGLPPAPIPPDLAPSDPQAWFDRQHRHLIDLIRYAAGAHRPGLAVALLAALTPYFRVYHLRDEWQQCIELATGAAKRAGDALAEGIAVKSAVSLEIVRSDHARGTALARQCLPLLDPANRRHVLYDLQYLTRRRGEVAEALRICAELLEACRDAGDTVLEAAAHQALGIIHREYLSDPDRAAHHFELALALASANPACREHSQISFGLASVYIRLGRHGEAEPLLAGTLEVLRARDDRPGIMSCLTGLAQVLPRPQAAAAIAEALAVAEEIGEPNCRAQTHRAWSRYAERFGAVEESIEHLSRAAELYRAIDSPLSLADAEAELARLRAPA